MNATEILATLRKLGKPETATIYQRHGSGSNVFGVLTSQLAKLQKKIKVDHELAMRLWETGNAEARMLALMIADPAQLTRSEAHRFLDEGPAHFVGHYLADLVARSPIADETMRAWTHSPDESARELGYSILGFLLKNDPHSISDEDAERFLITIEKEIHRSPNWARYAMNSAVISIGVRKPSLRQKALDAASRIGKVDVDHGETTCKTPDAAASIQKKRSTSPAPAASSPSPPDSFSPGT